MPEKKQTYGDYIRQMNDAELAALIDTKTCCDLCVHGHRCTHPYDRRRCVAGIVEFLGQERKVENGQEKEEAGAGAGCAGADEEGRA